jgi:tetratricopeptide (TPR) repeat protein
MADARPAGPEIFINQIVDSCVCGDSQTVAIVALHSNTGKLSIVDIKSGRDLIQPMTLPGPACSVATRSGTTDVAVLCQSGQILVVNQKNGTIRINIATPAWNGDARHSRLRYSSDGQRLIHLTVQSEIAVYDATSGQPCFPNISPLLSDSICRALAISADNRWLATGVNGRNAVQVWDLSTGKAVSEPLLHPGDLYGIFSIAFSPDGRWVLSGNKDGRARLWDWRTGKLVCPPLQHSDEVQSVAFTRDGQYALTGLRHGTLRVWELTTGKLIAPPIRYPLPERGSTGTMAVIGDQVIVSGLDFPIIDLSPLLKPPALSTDSMQLLAQLATGRRLELGELSSLSPAEWHDLWSESSARSMTIEQLANSVTRQVDRAVNIASRFLNVAKESKSEIVLVKPTPPRESAPEMPIVPDKNKQNDELTVSAKRQAILLLEQQIAARPDAGALAEELANLLLANRTSRWHPLEFSTVKSRDGAAFTRRNDGAFVVAQANSPEDIYKLNTVNGGQKVAAIRLDVLTDTSLPSQGPGRHPSGNFHLSAFRLVRPSIGEGQSDQGVPLSAAYSSYAYDAPDVDILGTIHANSKLVWHVWGKTSSSNHAVFVLDKPIIVNPQNPLIIELHHRAVGAAMNLGCFRLSASDDARAFDRDFDFQNIQSKVYSGAIALASAYTLIDQDANAIPLLEQATNLNSEYSAGIRLLLLSECHSRLNHTAESRKYYDELLVWLRLNRLPRSFQTRVTALMQAIGFLTAQQAKSNYQRLEIEHEQRNLTERIQRDPNSALLYFQRAELFARLGQWREAAADHVRMTEITPGDCLVWLRSAATLLMADDRDGHKALCQRLVSQFPKPAEPLIADCVCKSSLIVPDVIPMSDLPTAILIESINVNGEYAGWFTCNCALMSLREGNFTRSLELSQRFGNSPTGPSGALILTIRSLAQHHLQQTEAALQSLQQAESLIPVALRTLGTEKHTGPTAVDAYTVSHDWLVAELLRREAASVSRPAAK